MEISIKEKKYNLEYTSVIGVNYTYEVEFGSTVFADSQKMSDTSIHVRIAWAVLKTDNEVVECTFEDFRKSLSDKQWTDIFAFLTERVAALNPAIKAEAEEESKNA